jgi:Leucine-rich repeat (LRR) protein
MIVGPKDSKKSKRDHDSIMKKITHLHLEGKKIEIIENLTNCKNLTHVYLQENMIYTLVNDPFKGLDKII